MSGPMDNVEYVEDFAARIIRRAGVRVGEVYEGGDLGALAHLSRTVDLALVVAVEGMRAQGLSWQVVADELGVTRQTAFARFAGRVNRNNPTPLRSVSGA